MKQANEIWNQFVNKQIDAKEAVNQLNVLFAKAKPSEIGGLTAVYNKILDCEVPETEADEDLERDWWNHTHEED